MYQVFKDWAKRSHCRTGERVRLESTLMPSKQPSLTGPLHAYSGSLPTPVTRQVELTPFYCQGLTRYCRPSTLTLNLTLLPQASSGPLCLLFPGPSFPNAICQPLWLWLSVLSAGPIGQTPYLSCLPLHPVQTTGAT